MKHIKSLIFAMTVVGLAALLQATPTDTLINRRAKAGTPVVPGQWHAGFSAVKKYAEDNGLPLMAVWSNGDNCSHCLKFERGVNSSTFNTWMKDSGIVFYFGCDRDKGEDAYGGAAYNWCWKNQSLDLFPFVRYYWRAKKGTRLADGTVLTADKVLVDAAYTGDKVDSYKDNAEGSAKIKAFTLARFKQFSPVPPVTYYGGAFPFGDVAGNRLEAEVGQTKEIWVELSRTNKLAVAQAATNHVVTLAQFPAKSAPIATTNRIDWAAGAATAGFALKLPDLSGAGATNVTITLTLLDEKLAPVEGETRHVTVVTPQPNSAKNPYFGEERTAETLGYGEWTMNLEAVKGKVAKDGGYRLILVEGALWCPDCAAAEQNMWSRSEFTAWAKANKVALGVVDIPNLKASQKTDASNSPCLLTTVAVNGKSGADYLSRHGITAAEAGATLARNLELASKTVLEAGFRRPESGNTDRIGVPTLVLVRADGTVAGRFTDFAVKGPAAFDASYLRRFDELLARAADMTEEANDAYRTTTADVATQGLTTGTLSANDRSDWDKVSSTAVGSAVDFRVSGESDASVTLELVQVTSTGALKVIQTVTKTLDAADFVVWSEQLPKDCFVRVVVDEASASFAQTAADDSTVAYTLESSIVLKAADKTQTYTSATGSVSLSVEEGASYLLQGVDTTVEDFLAVFDSGETADIYVAKETTSVNLTLTGSELTYANWKTGRISFALAGASVSETAGEYILRVVREGGASGSAKAVIRVDREKTTTKEDIFEFAADGRELTWTDGDNHEEELIVKILDNPYADGESRVTLTLTKQAGDAGVGTRAFELRIVDDDKPVPGKLALRPERPLLAKPGVLIAKAGSTVSFAVCREGGAWGALTGTLSASVGELSETSFAWGMRETNAVPVTIVAPSSGTTTLTLKGTNGAKVTSSARTVKVQVVPADAPEFEFDRVAATVTRYMATEPLVVGVREPQGDETVTKVSGSLPAGLSVRLTDGRLVVSGVATAAAGVYTAVYQVCRGKKKGLTVAVKVTVLDPAVKAPDATAPAVNPSVAKARTLTDIRLIDTESNVLEGMLTLTIPRTGRLSAKLRSLHFGTVAFASPSWAAYGADGKTLEAVLTCTTVRSLSFRVAAAPDGSVSVSEFDGYVLTIPAEAFSAGRTAADWEGPYNVSLAPNDASVDGSTPLAVGAGYLLLKKLSASGLKTGRVTYAGLLPNGKGVSGSTVMVPGVWNAEKANWDNASVAVASASSTDLFSTVLDIARRGNNDTKPGTWFRKPVTAAAACRWEHVERISEASYAVDFGVYGTKYDKGENLENCCLAAFETKDLSFFVTGLDRLVFEKYGTPAPWQAKGYGVDISYTTKAGNRIVKQTSGAAKGFGLSFDAANGLLSGTFALPTDEGSVPMSFKAVVMPGWGAASCTSCGGDAAAAERPFISGCAWADDVFSYADATRERTLKVRRGAQVTVGVEPGM